MQIINYLCVFSIPSLVGQDYAAPVNSVITFVPGGVEELCIAVPILDDNLQEGTETFRVSLVSLNGFAGSLGDPAIVSIVDTPGMLSCPSSLHYY